MFNQNTYGTVYKKASKVVKKHAPKILMGVGFVGFGLSVMTAYKAGYEMAANGDERVEKVKESFEKVKETKDPKDAGVMTYHAVQLAKPFALPTIGFVVGVAGVSAGFGVLSKRAAAATAAATIAWDRYESLKGRLKAGAGDKFVDAVENGGEIKKNDIGNKKSESVKFEIFLDNDDLIYTFDESNPEWSENPDVNFLTVSAAIDHIKRLYSLHGVVVINDLLEALGIPKSKEGSVLGWSVDHTHAQGDVVVSTSEQSDGVILIKPMPDGVVVDYY